MVFNSRVKNLQSVQGLSRRATSAFFTPIVLEGRTMSGPITPCGHLLALSLAGTEMFSRNPT